MKIYTRRGDAGETDLFGGERVGKDDPRVDAYGGVDELNAALGVVAAATSHGDVRELTQSIQATLFQVGAILATPDPRARAKSGTPEPRDEDVRALEDAIDRLDGELEPLKRFILPGGAPAAAACHSARAVCRRAERRVVGLGETAEAGAISSRYLNRLSDLLFVLARVETRRASVREVEWIGRERGSG